MLADPHNSEMIYFTVKTIIIGNGLKQAKEVHVIAWYFEKIKFSTFFGNIRPHFSFVLRWSYLDIQYVLSREKIICSLGNNVFLLYCTQRILILDCIMLHAQCVH